MKTVIRYLTPLLAAAAIGGAISLAPAALADPGPRPVANSFATHNGALTPTSDWPEHETGVDPLVPANTGADPFVLTPYGQGRAF